MTRSGDRAASPPRPSVCIVGRGFTGAAAAVALLQRIKFPFTLTMIDPSPTLGGGLAYGEARAGELLNVRALNLTISAFMPGDFAQWLSRRLAGESVRPLGVDVGALFAPRTLFADYAAERLRGLLEARPSVDFRLADVSAERVQPLRGGRFEVGWRGGAVEADFVMLATGYGGAGRRRRFGLDPFAEISASALERASRIVVVGGGLTMVDAVLRLRRQGYSGGIDIVASRGLMPMPQSLKSDDSTLRPWTTDAGDTLRTIVRRVRAACEAEMARGGDWRCVVDSLRPHAQTLWRGFTREEKRRFQRHMKRYWDIHRHRAPPEQHQRLMRELVSDRTRLIVGRVLAVDGDGPSVVTLRRRGSRSIERMPANFVIDCSGHVPRVDTPIIRSLTACGLAQWDDLGVGLAVGPNGGLSAGDGSHSDSLFALGPLGAGSLMEITAAHEIVAQAAHAADAVEARARPRSGRRRANGR